MTLPLSGRRILVTGAARGIGEGIAQHFSENGAALALLDREWNDGPDAPRNAQAYSCDVTDRAKVNEVVARAANKLGGLDGVVNAAGILDIVPFDQLTPESWDRMIAVNMTGPFNIVKAALPFLRQVENATIVNIGSVSGLLPMAGTAGYSASKGGVHMFTKGLAYDLAPKIRANTICPGTIRSGMTSYIFDNPEHLARASQRAALKRVGEPIDIARAALFLSTEASGYTTGTELVVDGGFSWR